MILIKLRVPRSLNAFLAIFIIISTLVCFIQIERLLNLRLHFLGWFEDSSTTSTSNNDAPLEESRTTDGVTFQLVQDHCKIPYVPTYTKIFNVSSKIKLDPELDKCDDEPDFTELEDNILYLTDLSLKNSCCVYEISRPQFLPQDDFILSEDCQTFQDGKLNISHMEFVKVICEGERKGRKQINFQANIPETGNIEKKREACLPYSDSFGYKRPISIFVLVIDSVSRTDAYRGLNKTMDMLVNKLDFVDFKGHHPLAEPTMNNALALLIGLKGEDFWQRYKFSREEFWDAAPFLWKIFNDLDYVTGYFEDMPGYGTFNYGGQRGFASRPTDLSLRPVFLAHGREFPYKRKKLCFGHRGAIKFMLDHHLEAMKRLRDVPTFLVSWPVWPQHDVPHTLFTQDDNYAEFFQNVAEDKDVLDDTLFIVMSDHAFNHDKYAKTHYGLLERRTVPLLIRVPNRLKEDFPNAVENLMWNSEIVTGHFDVYQTLLQLAEHFDEHGVTRGQGFKKYGKSLLEKLRENRSCEDASILSTMCSCNLSMPEDDPSSMFPNSTHNSQLLIDSKQFPAFLA